MFGLVRRLVLALAALAVVGVVAAPAAQAVDPTPVVHSETAQVGPYAMRVSFTDWPVYAGKSLDFTFLPEDGIAGHTARMTMYRPNGDTLRTTRAQRTAKELQRFVRGYDRWGLDTFLLPDQGTWRFEFTVDGPKGHGVGSVSFPVGAMPGPPLAVSWAVGLLPAIAVLPIGVLLWLRGRRNRHPVEWSWA
ncbi:hypothetical protein F0L68_25120 [Solihabitans fulvus]|uniref:Uncharacterized protein n=1 Tax=Solihabitans fulvus TaxID=1892852 RepID=A0A5B2X322_9PSEU|nr:hypothetical protein [Solihabitans fulvus]KAA2257580.1 hypothetical protein F0L68_25120 [Solihabitans fulvus]